MGYPKQTTLDNVISFNQPDILERYLHDEGSYDDHSIFSTKNNILGYSYYIQDISLSVQNNQLLTDMEMKFLQSINHKLVLDTDSEIRISEEEYIIFDCTKSKNNDFIMSLCKKYMDYGVYLNIKFVISLTVIEKDNVYYNDDYIIRMENLRLFEYSDIKGDKSESVVFFNVNNIITAYKRTLILHDDKSINDAKSISIIINNENNYNGFFKKLYNEIYDKCAINRRSFNYFESECCISNLYINLNNIEKCLNSFYNYTNNKKDIPRIDQFLDNITFNSDTTLYAMMSIPENSSDKDKQIFSNFCDYLKVLQKYSADSVISFNLTNKDDKNDFIIINCTLINACIININKSNDVLINCRITNTSINAF